MNGWRFDESYGIPGLDEQPHQTLSSREVECREALSHGRGKGDQVRLQVDKYGSVSNVPGLQAMNNGGGYVGY
ncbi:hypothetical protein [Cystobacter ferrugineus]|uniref:Uncharacterized protein n=1 Tax=Cystobacter ferrugineus TaxID=83449 RepID=A0A1L9BBF9_9BACT|nr:hypothetical protein [Cystobacter ferrugineus]OJH39533.1 hypothetical protein BON30_18735 [Cystobacter ferrugineus]